MNTLETRKAQNHAKLFHFSKISTKEDFKFQEPPRKNFAFTGFSVNSALIRNEIVTH